MFGEQKRTDFLSVREGLFTLTAKEGEERWGTVAKRRVYESKEGLKKEVWEFTTKSLVGDLLDVRINKTDFGEMLYIEVSTEQGDFTISIPTDSKYARAFMTRYPGIKKGIPVRLYVYDYEDNGDRKLGMGIEQEIDGEKVKLGDYFYDFDKKTYKHDHPAPGKEMDSDMWKIYFLMVTKFLKNYLNEHPWK